MPSSPRKRPRVAVVGTGLAGLSTAYLLERVHAYRTDGTRVQFDVHLLDRSDTLGMDTASISVKNESGSVRVDVPMRSINGGSHSRVHKLYQRLRVPLVKSDFTYSFSRLAHPGLWPPPPAPDSIDDPTVPSIPPTPPPEYRESPNSRPPTPPHPDDPTPGRKVKAPAANRPSQATALLYEGASGLRWPPISVPSHLAQPVQWHARVSYFLDVMALTAAYLYLVLLALFYCALGLAYPPKPPCASTLHRRIASWPRRAMARGVSAALASLPRAFQLRNLAHEPLIEWCARHRLPNTLTEDVLVPLMAAVATVGLPEARTMPVGEVLQYVSSTLFAPHYVTHPAFGVRGIVAALAASVPSDRIHLGVDITRIEQVGVGEGEGGWYRVHLQRPDGQADTLEVDHLVLATQADQAARLLETMHVRTAQEQGPQQVHEEEGERENEPGAGWLSTALDALRAFTYVRTLVVTHTDRSVLPHDSRDWRDLNLAVVGGASTSSTSARTIQCLDRAGSLGGYVAVHPEEERAEAPTADAALRGDDASIGWDESCGYLPASSVQTTHILSRLREPSPPENKIKAGRKKEPPTSSPPLLLLQTTNPLVPIDPEHTLASTWFSRAFVTRQSQQAVGQLAALQGGGPPPGLGCSPDGLKRPLECIPSEEGRRNVTAAEGGGGGARGGVWFTGSYLAEGIPLLEGCVSSAETVVAGLFDREGGIVEQWAF